MDRRVTNLWNRATMLELDHDDKLLNKTLSRTCLCVLVLVLKLSQP